MDNEEKKKNERVVSNEFKFVKLTDEELEMDYRERRKKLYAEEEKKIEKFKKYIEEHPEALDDDDSVKRR